MARASSSKSKSTGVSQNRPVRRADRRHVMPFSNAFEIRSASPSPSCAVPPALCPVRRPPGELAAKQSCGAFRDTHPSAYRNVDSCSWRRPIPRLPLAGFITGEEIHVAGSETLHLAHDARE